jgi:hypothetical protein
MPALAAAVLTSDDWLVFWLSVVVRFVETVVEARTAFESATLTLSDWLVF